MNYLALFLLDCNFKCNIRLIQSLYDFKNNLNKESFISANTITDFIVVYYIK